MLAVDPGCHGFRGGSVRSRCVLKGEGSPSTVGVRVLDYFVALRYRFSRRFCVFPCLLLRRIAVKCGPGCKVQVAKQRTHFVSFLLCSDYVIG